MQGAGTRCNAAGWPSPERRLGISAVWVQTSDIQGLFPSFLGRAELCRGLQILCVGQAALCTLITEPTLMAENHKAQSVRWLVKSRAKR